MRIKAVTLFLVPVLFPAAHILGLSRSNPDIFTDSTYISARNVSLGGSGIASAGPGSAFNNPGALPFIFSPEMLATYIPLHLGAGMTEFSYVHNFTKIIAAGLAFSNFASGDMDRMDDFGELTGSYEFRHTAFSMTAGKKFEDIQAGAGLRLKYVSETILDYTDFSFGLDLGGYKTLSVGDFWLLKDNRASLGASLRNLRAPSLKLKSETVDYPLALQAGFRIETWNGRLALNIDMLVKEKYGARIMLGLEGRPYYGVFVRAGLDHGYFCAGFGLSIRNASIDYSLSPRDLSVLHLFSFRYRFNPPLTVEEEKVENIKQSIMSFSRAISNIENQDYAAAVKDLKTANALDPENQSIERLLDNVDKTLKNIEADRIFEEGLTFYSKMDYETAEERFSRTLAMNKEHRMARTLRPVNLTYMYLAQGQMQKAKETILKALEEFPDSETIKGILSRIRILEKY